MAKRDGRPAAWLSAGSAPVAVYVSVTASFAAAARLSPFVTLLRIVKSWYAGRATAARMPTIATTIISSIKVNPFCILFILVSEVVVASWLFHATREAMDVPGAKHQLMIKCAIETGVPRVAHATARPLPRTQNAGWSH